MLLGTMRLTSLLAPLVSIPLTLSAQTAASTPEQIFAKTTEATALVLTGEGGGRLQGVATAVVVRPNGILLTAYHVVKNAQEVQVRLSNGEAYDRVELIGFDERRDVAALRITASALPALPMGESGALKAGDLLYTVGSSGGLKWSANQGIYSSMRSADEVPGAGDGFRLMQTTIPVVPGASGGPVVTAEGKLVGLFIARSPGATFAVPIESVAGLADGDMHRQLGIGSALRMPESEDSRSPAAAAVAATKPADVLLRAKTVVITSKTAFFTPETLERTLTGDEDYKKLGLVIVKDRRVADLVIEIDRPLFTYVHTYTVFDQKTTIVLLTGKVTAFDGTTASGPMAKQIVKALLKQKMDAEVAKPAVPAAK